MSKNNTGLFITFEGPDGSGKSTVINTIYEKLINYYSNNKNIIKTREPGGNSFSENLRKLLFTYNDSIDVKTQALLYACARNEHYSKTISSVLNNNGIVLCDRFIDSSLVYQGIMQKIGVDKIFELNNWFLDNKLPDITYLLLCDIETTKKRILLNRQENNFLDNINDSLLNEIYNGYILIANKYPNRIVIINANNSLDLVINDIWNDLLKRL